MAESIGGLFFACQGILHIEKQGMAVRAGKDGGSGGRSPRALRHLHFAVLAAVFCALAHGLGPRRADAIPKTPIGSRSVRARGNRSAFTIKPHHDFTVGSTFRTIFHGDAFGVAFTVPFVGKALRSAFAPIGDGAVGGARRLGVCAFCLVRRASALIIIAAVGLADLRPRRRGHAQSQQYDRTSKNVLTKYFSHEYMDRHYLLKSFLDLPFCNTCITRPTSCAPPR